MVDGLSRPVSPQFDDRAVIIGRAGFEVLRFQRRRNPRRLELKTAISGVPLAEFRSEEHTSELQSLMRISYAVFCLKKKKNNHKDIMSAYTGSALYTTSDVTPLETNYTTVPTQ